MPSIRSSFVFTLLLFSVLANVVLGFSIYLDSVEAKRLREELIARQQERDLVMDLIPRLKPQITKPQLRALLRRTYPSERVNDAADHLQWRLFQFWFKDDMLETVRRSS